MHAATLETLIDLAKARCDAAQVRHAAMQRAAEQARVYLATLQQYAHEYDIRARCQEGDSRDPSAERNQIVFLARLQLAVETQERELESRVTAVTLAAQELAQCLQRRRSLETLAERRREEERRLEARRDQKIMDEFAQRAGARAAAAGLHAETIKEGQEQ